MSTADTTKQTAAAAAEPERLDLRSHDLVGNKQEELLRLFPEARTEGEKVDLDRLRLALGQSVDVGKERYGMNWPGKVDCFRTIQTPSVGTLRPSPEESVDFDTTQNLIIEGDNLEVLKLLQKSYLGKIKMIYIDPPYNTGNDFIYPDNYSESLQTYLEYTGQVDAEGQKFGTNTDADGRFHSKWLEPISKSFKQYQQGCELHKAQEVFRIVLPARHNTALPLEPGKKALDLPPPRVAT